MFRIGPYGAAILVFAYERCTESAAYIVTKRRKNDYCIKREKSLANERQTY